MINQVLIILIFVILCMLLTDKEKWCNTYSGWPGPLENPYRTNIPALYGDPKYESKCNYKFGLDKNTPYLTMRGYPE
jgi:predicted small secreted protein